MSREEKQEEVNQWLRKSQRDLKVAYVLLENEALLFDSAVYHCQQAAEKALKAYLTDQNAIVRKTHDLEVLIGLCAEYDPSFENLADAADILNPYATEFRYPGDVTEPGREDVEEAIALSESIIKVVIQSLADATDG